MKWLVVWTTGIFNDFSVFLFFFFLFSSSLKIVHTNIVPEQLGHIWKVEPLGMIEIWLQKHELEVAFFQMNFWLPSTLSMLELINLNSWTNLLENRSFTWWRYFTTKTRMLCQNAFLFKFMFSLGNKETIEKKQASFNRGQWQLSGFGSKITSSCKWPLCSCSIYYYYYISFAGR